MGKNSLIERQSTRKQRDGERVKKTSGSVRGEKDLNSASSGDLEQKCTGRSNERSDSFTSFKVERMERTQWDTDFITPPVPAIIVAIVQSFPLYEDNEDLRVPKIIAEKIYLKPS